MDRLYRIPSRSGSDAEKTIWVSGARRDPAGLADFRVTGWRYWWAWAWRPNVSLGETLLILGVVLLLGAIWP